MSTLAKLALLLTIVSVVAALSSWATFHFIVPKPPRSDDFHHWLHSQLALTAEQDKALDQKEERFAAQRKELVETIRKDNAELGAAIAQDREFSPRVQTAVEKIHHAQGDLENATLDHIFGMKSILSPQQFARLLKLTTQALNSSSDL